MPEGALWICTFAEFGVESTLRNKPLLILMQVQAVIPVGACPTQPMLAHLKLNRFQIRNDMPLSAVGAVLATPRLESLANLEPLRHRGISCWEVSLETKL